MNILFSKLKVKKIKKTEKKYFTVHYKKRDKNYG